MIEYPITDLINKAQQILKEEAGLAESSLKVSKSRAFKPIVDFYASKETTIYSEVLMLREVYQTSTFVWKGPSNVCNETLPDSFELPITPFRFIIRHVSARNSGVMMYANEVKRAFTSKRALIAILSNCVDILIYLYVCRICVFVRNSFCLAASPCMWLSHTPSTISESDSHRSIRLPVDGPFSWRTPSPKTTMGLPGSALFLFPSCCALRPRRGLQFPRH
ncbi:MAG TPA: hypothetical protein DEF42_07100 [Desulfosporosinus sp.]|nr:hypothetical protein [Desulfosporosinus sp.]